SEERPEEEGPDEDVPTDRWGRSAARRRTRVRLRWPDRLRRSGRARGPDGWRPARPPARQHAARRPGGPGPTRAAARDRPSGHGERDEAGGGRRATAGDRLGLRHRFERTHRDERPRGRGRREGPGEALRDRKSVV